MSGPHHLVSMRHCSACANTHHRVHEASGNSVSVRATRSDIEYNKHAHRNNENAYKTIRPSIAYTNNDNNNTRYLFNSDGNLIRAPQIVIGSSGIGGLLSGRDGTVAVWMFPFFMFPFYVLVTGCNQRYNCMQKNQWVQFQNWVKPKTRLAKRALLNFRIPKKPAWTPQSLRQ